MKSLVLLLTVAAALAAALPTTAIKREANPEAEADPSLFQSDYVFTAGYTSGP